MQVCFIGHRNIEITEQLILSLKKAVLGLIDEGAKTFLFGSMSSFDTLSWEIVTELKKEHPFIKRVYVRSANQHIDKSYEEYLLTLYEETYFPPKLEKAGKYSYVERNYEMINRSNCCVFYYNKNLSPILSVGRKSGTKIAYEYAIKKKKTIINLYR